MLYLLFNPQSDANCQVRGLRSDKSHPGPSSMGWPQVGLDRVRSPLLSPVWAWVQVTSGVPLLATSLPPPPTLLCQTGGAIKYC